MHIRYHAQRKHIAHSLNSLLYQLHTVSFLLAPSLLVLICRCATQFQFARARELDGRRALAFWLVSVAFINAGGVWTHATAPPPGQRDRSVILDFVGRGRDASRLQLLLLDATIMLLQVVLTTIAYETSLARVMPDDYTDPLLPSDPNLPDSFNREPNTVSFLQPPSPSSSSTHTYPPSSTSPLSSLTEIYPSETSLSISKGTTTTVRFPPRAPVILLSMKHIWHRLRSPPPEPPPGTVEEDAESVVRNTLRLPLPTITRSMQLAGNRRRQQQQRRAQALLEEISARDNNGPDRRESGGEVAEGRIPGALEEDTEM